MSAPLGSVRSVAAPADPRPLPPLVDLSQHWARELTELSSIAPAIITERGYRTLRWTANDARDQRFLREQRIPSWARDTERGGGLLIPLYRATGERISFQYKPEKAVRDRQGKYRKYASIRGHTNRIDVHPRNRAKVVDPTVPLWITEGIKKADALTSRGRCVVAITGVFNWRSQLGTLGDWEDIPLKNREIFVCFDADATTNMNVLRAMVRLGRWLKSKGTKKVHYLIVPSDINGTKVKGADDYLAAGGTIEGLLAAATTTEPDTEIADDTFTDARLAETIADDVLDGHYLWCKALSWLAWTGQRWEPATDETVTEAIRQYALQRFAEVIDTIRVTGGHATSSDALSGWRSMLSAGRQRSVLGLCRGIVQRKAHEFDADPDVLNTPSGMVDLTTGEVTPHDPNALATKITKGRYLPGHTHPDWETAQEVLPKQERTWFQTRIGQAITGHTTPDGILPILQGSGENGKSLLTTDGLLPALGDYGDVVSPKLITSMRPGGNEHSTEIADLRGQRLLVAEEMTEGRALDVTTIKRIQDVGLIKARYVHKDNMTFQASHSLLATTNYVPVVTETDHGTWRRLALLRFPYTYRKPPCEQDCGTCRICEAAKLTRPTDRRGDPDLKARIKTGAGGQHDAIVTWAVAGAVRYATTGAASLALPDAIVADTTAWRADADRVLGYWADKLIPDPTACVLATDLLDHFNTWLKENGHQAWSKETFAPKFGQHNETTRHGVQQRRTSKPVGLVRPEAPHPFATVKPVPAQPLVWVGVRYRTVADLRESDSLAEVAEAPETLSRKELPKRFTGASATSATKITTKIVGTHTPGPVSSSLSATSQSSGCEACGTPLDPFDADPGDVLCTTCTFARGVLRPHTPASRGNRNRRSP